MRSLWTEIKYVKSAARILGGDCVNKRGLDLFKEVLWVSVGQSGAKLWSIKHWGYSNRPGLEPWP